MKSLQWKLKEFQTSLTPSHSTPLHTSRKICQNNSAIIITIKRNSPISDKFTEEEYDQYQQLLQESSVFLKKLSVLTADSMNEGQSQRRIVHDLLLTAYAISDQIYPSDQAANYVTSMLSLILDRQLGRPPKTHH